MSRGGAPSPMEGAVLALSALTAGFCLAFLDMLADQLPLIVVLLGVFGFVFGALGPRWALLTGALVGIPLPIAKAFVGMFNLRISHPMHGFYGGALAIIPPIVGALAGMAFRGWFDEMLESRRQSRAYEREGEKPKAGRSA